MSHRILDLETVHAMGPLLARIAEDLAQAYFEVCMLHAVEGEPTPSDLGEAHDRVQGFVTEIEKLGGHVRSYDPVAVDFIAEVDAEIGYLRWSPADVRFEDALARRPSEVA